MSLADIEEIADRSAAEIALAYRAGEADPVAVTECFLERITKAAEDNIFIFVSGERAMREAEAARERYRDGRPLSVLDGVPIAWKDLLDVAGSPTTAGSILFKDDPPRQKDSTVVAHAAAAGMVSLGKLNMTELAFSGLGLNPHFGTPVNPADRSVHRSPGGSSSGSGAAVAARLAPIAIGSDTGGSVRVPASYNGVVGFKTSEGRVAEETTIALSRTLDTIGPLAHSVRDCALAEMVLRGAVNLDATRMDVRELSLIVPTNVVFDEAEAAVTDNFERSIEALVRAGAKVERRPLDCLARVVEVTAQHGSLISAEAYHEHKAAVEGQLGDQIDRRVVRRILQGRDMSAYDLLVIQTERARLIEELGRDLAGSLLAMPTTQITAPAVAPLEADDDYFHTINMRTLRNTTIGNFLKTCGLAIPNGRDRHGLPTSFLMSSVYGDDDRLLGFGLDVERILSPLFEPKGL